ncbi:MAG: efflux RND transporter permease subunit [Kiritimatiellaeota bacterium]|nr:efflux RND transporter permease subunit [Kiritimatiellota bacterium]
MFLATASTKRPIAMCCLLIALCALGLNSFRKLSLERMPSVDIPFAVVVTTWIGASPEDIEKDITRKIEDAVSGIDGLKTVESSSMENVSQVFLEFALSVKIDVAAQDIREKIDGILSDLPKDSDRPVIQKVNLNSLPIVNLFLSGELPIDDLYDYAANTLSDRFATVPGVAEVQVIGGNEREVWVELDRDALAAAGLTAMDVCAAIQSGVLNLPSGNVRENGSELSIRFDAEYRSIPEIADLDVVSKNGMRLALRDVGTVRQASKEVRERATLNGQQGIVMKIVKKAEGNTVAVVTEAQKRLQEVQKSLPGGMALAWVSDESESVKESFAATLANIWQAVAICAFVLFIFLFNVRTTLVVAITMPVTFVISLFFLWAFGQTLNVISLMAIGLSTGVLVSNSIVVLENVVSKFETMDDHWEAARIGTSEMTVAVLASAGTNVIVMFPIAMMTSMAGRMLTPFAIATLVVNAVSIFISFTLTPILAAKLLKPASQQKPTLMTRCGKALDRALHGTGSALASTLRLLSANRLVNLLIVVGFVALFVVTMKVCGARIGFSFMEIEDYGRITLRIEMPAHYSLEATTRRVEGIADRLSELSDTENVLVTVGRAIAASGQANTGVYLGQVELMYPSKNDREWNILDRTSDIRQMLADETDCRIDVGVANAIGMRSYGIEYILMGDDFDTLKDVAEKIGDAGLAIDGMETIDSTVRDPKPELRIVPKRTVLADLNLSPATLATLVRANLDGILVADYRKGDRTSKIRVKLAEKDGKDQIAGFLLPGLPGRPVLLESLAEVIDSQTTLQIFRHDRMRGTKILGDLTPGATPGVIGKQLETAVAENRLLPAGYRFEVGGDGKRMAEIQADFMEAILLAAFLTLLILCAILESWTRPGIILLTLPMGLMGVFLGLAVTGKNINIMTLLGMLMLIGIVVNAAILVIDKMAQFIKGGMCRRDAVFAALVDQFRPVLMVVLASGLGMLPLALGTGLGSENRSAIGVASVTGVIIAGLLTLTVLPLFYTAFTKKK